MIAMITFEEEEKSKNETLHSQNFLVYTPSLSNDQLVEELSLTETPTIYMERLVSKNFQNISELGLSN